jgi:CDP-glycerol glycerophosphotransferase
MYLAMREFAPHIRGAWIVKLEGAETVPDDAQHVLPNTREYFRVLARAKYLVNNVNFPNEITKRTGQIHVQTQHGTPLKTMGLDQQAYPVGAGDTDFGDMLRRSDRWDYHLSQNRFSTEVWERSFPCDYEILESGYPRNDVLFRATDGDVQRLRESIGIRPGQVAILYTPTHRDYHRTFQPMLDLGRFARALGPSFTILMRTHYFYSPRVFRSPADAATVLDVSTWPYTEELMLASDVLLTDYSSIMFDYAVLDRPIVVFANDWDTYVRTRGVNFDLLATPPGAVAMTPAELADVFTTGDYAGPAANKARAEFRRQFVDYDDGGAAERVVRHIFLGQLISRVAFPAEADPVERATMTS